MRVRSAAFLGTPVMAMLAINPAVLQAVQGSNTVPSLDAYIASASGLSNPCAEGEFLDLDVDVCAPLVKSYGFDAAAFLEQADTTQHDFSACDGNELESLLDDLPAAGGVVNLPACTINLTGTLSLPNNVVLQGAGSGQTIIKAGPSMVDDNMLRAKHVQNLVIRDLTVDGSGLSSHGILIWYSTNALVERVEVIDTAQSGVSFRHAQQVTIRYIESRGHTGYHGVSSKDCSPEDDTVPDLEECQAEAGNTAPGVLWSRDYAVYSNHLHENASHGLNSHASEGEIAGNSIHNNGYGTKFPDTTLLWIHHNEIFDNGNKGLHIYSTLDIPERAPNRNVIYENFFGGNADYPVRIADSSLEIYLLYNSYSANSPNELRVKESEIFVCPETEDAALELAGETRKEATEQECDLSQVGSLFSEGGEPPDCFSLSLSHTGAGAEPVASPAQSQGCTPGMFVAGEVVGLVALPDPASEVSGWNGTENDGSTSTQNSVTMPASSHAAAVGYVESLFVLNRLVLQNKTLVGASLYEACISIKVGSNVDIAPGAAIFFRAPTIVMYEMVNVPSDAQFTAETSYPPRCLS